MRGCGGQETSVWWPRDEAVGETRRGCGGDKTRLWESTDEVPRVHRPGWGGHKTSLWRRQDEPVDDTRRGSSLHTCAPPPSPHDLTPRTPLRYVPRCGRLWTHVASLVLPPASGGGRGAYAPRPPGKPVKIRCGPRHGNRGRTRAEPLETKACPLKARWRVREGRGGGRSGSPETDHSLAQGRPSQWRVGKARPVRSARGAECPDDEAVDLWEWFVRGLARGARGLQLEQQRWDGHDEE